MAAVPTDQGLWCAEARAGLSCRRLPSVTLGTSIRANEMGLSGRLGTPRSCSSHHPLASPSDRSYKHAMRRGTSAERLLAWTGAIIWVVWAVNGLSLITLVFGVVGVVMSIVEYRRWQRWERIGSGTREGEYVYPRWAWYAVGAVPAILVVGFVYGVVLAISGRALPTERPGAVILVAFIIWIAAGLTTERLLVRAAKRRETVPPPPPGAILPTTSREPRAADDEPRRRRSVSHPEPRTSERPHDPRGRL